MASRPVCVGIDDLHPSISAMRFALEEASERKVQLVVLTSWAADKRGNYGISVNPDELEEYESAIRREQHSTVDDAASRGRERPDIVHSIIQSVGPHPGRDLVRAAAECDVLVVGRRKESDGHARVGSTAAYCVRHSRTPVVVVPDEFESTAS